MEVKSLRKKDNTNNDSEIEKQNNADFLPVDDGHYNVSFFLSLILFDS